MPKQIEYGGQIHEFPDDFTDNDISDALHQVDLEVERTNLQQLGATPTAEEERLNSNIMAKGVSGMPGQIKEHAGDMALGAAQRMVEIPFEALQGLWDTVSKTFDPSTYNPMNLVNKGPIGALREGDIGGALKSAVTTVAPMAAPMINAGEKLGTGDPTQVGAGLVDTAMAASVPGIKPAATGVLNTANRLVTRAGQVIDANPALEVASNFVPFGGQARQMGRIADQLIKQNAAAAAASKRAIGPTKPPMSPMAAKAPGMKAMSAQGRAAMADSVANDRMIAGMSQKPTAPTPKPAPNVAKGMSEAGGKEAYQNAAASDKMVKGMGEAAKRPNAGGQLGGKKPDINTAVKEGLEETRKPAPVKRVDAPSGQGGAKPVAGAVERADIRARATKQDRPSGSSIPTSEYTNPRGTVVKAEKKASPKAAEAKAPVAGSTKTAKSTPDKPQAVDTSARSVSDEATGKSTDTSAKTARAQEQAEGKVDNASTPKPTEAEKAAGRGEHPKGVDGDKLSSDVGGRSEAAGFKDLEDVSLKELDRMGGNIDAITKRNRELAKRGRK